MLLHEKKNWMGLYINWINKSNCIIVLIYVQVKYVAQCHARRRTYIHYLLNVNNFEECLQLTKMLRIIIVNTD